MSQVTTHTSRTETPTIEVTDLTATYTRILPLSADKIDLFAFFSHFSTHISHFIDLCLRQSAWEMDVHFLPENATFFQNQYFESKNLQKTRGQHTFGFGFPLVFDTDTEGYVVTAPLFVWYLSVRPHPNRHDSWILSFDENSPIAVNDYFVAHCRQKYNLDLNKELTDFSFKRPFHQITNGFDGFCKNLAQRLNFDVERINPGLKECPKELEMNELAAIGTVLWSGVMGLFPHQAGSLAENKAQDIDFQNFTWTAEHAHEFAPLPEDTYQREALRTILRNKMTLVEGAHGTGKTYLAANIVLNALSNGQKVAVVAEDTGSLMQIQNQLVNLGLGNLTFLLRDIYHDKKLLLDVMRNEQYGKTVDFKEEDFKIALKQARRLLGKSDDSHVALSRPIFGDFSFAEVVGLLQKSRQISGDELLANHLKASDFEFDKAEHAILSEQIAQSQTLYKTVGTLKHPLDTLHPSVFEQPTSEKGHEFAAFELAIFIESWKSLHHRHITVYDQYAQKLMTHYENHHDALRTQLRHLREAYSDFQFQFGEAFEDNSLLRISGLRTSALFSNRSKNVLTAKEDVVQQYEELQKIYNQHKYFTHSFLKKSEQKDFKKLQTNLETFELVLRGWRKSLAAIVQEELQRLNSKTSQYFDKNMSETIHDLETDLDRLTASTNDRQLYAAPFAHKMLTLPKRMAFIEETLEKLTETQLYLPQFDSFYTWQRHWLGMNPVARKVTQALIKVKPDEWVATFDSWYFHHTLLAHYQSNTLNNDDLMRQMNEAESRLCQLLPSQIGHLWSERKRESIKLMKVKNTEGYRYFFHAKNQDYAKGLFLKDILKKNITTFTDIFPVLLMTPQVASQIIENEGKEFDVTIFDNAQFIDAEKAVSVLRNTEGVVALCENTDVAELSPRSIVAKMIAQHVPLVRLGYLHRPVSMATRQLNQRIFYKNLEVPLQGKAAEQHIFFSQTTGRFNPEKGTNDAEIAETIHLIEDLHALPTNVFPRIGIVCMTKQQRNLLSDNLLHIIQKTLYGWEKIEQMQRNGLSVLSIEEMIGMQFDVLIVNGTFSSLSEAHLSMRQMRKLLNSFTQKLYWVNSISTDELAESARITQADAASFGLANLILMGKSLAQNDTPQYEEAFNRLSAIYDKYTPVKQSEFVDQVVQELARFVEKTYLKPYCMLDTQIFDLVVIPKFDKQSPIIVRIDGKLSRSRYFNADWERRTLAVLEKMQIPVVSIWSYNWWRNPKDEAFKLAQAIFSYDRRFEL